VRRRIVFRLLGLGVLGALALALFGAGPYDPDFCEKRCPICTRARAGNACARFLQRIELALTGGGCPWGRARQRKYGVRPDEPLPQVPRPTA
jgi:hypothetical protein